MIRCRPSQVLSFGQKIRLVSLKTKDPEQVVPHTGQECAVFRTNYLAIVRPSIGPMICLRN